jgi:putative endonuclease
VSRETTTELGRRAEARAVAYLEASGLRLLERNFRCRGGEIDLVMLDGETLVLVEVRSRASTAFGGAAASVDGRKQRRLILAARRLLLVRPAYRALRARFDVVAFDADGALSAKGAADASNAAAAADRTGTNPPASSPPVRIDWIRDAFRLA